MTASGRTRQASAMASCGRDRAKYTRLSTVCPHGNCGSSSNAFRIAASASSNRSGPPRVECKSMLRRCPERVELHGPAAQ